MAASKYLDIYLLRHGHSTANGKGVLAGRDNKVQLSPEGIKQSKQVAAALSDIKFSRIVSSPIQRCLQTLSPIPATPVDDDRFSEMDYGDWSGKKLSLLSTKPLWKDIQSRPSIVRFPNGESFLEMNARTSDAINELSQKTKGQILICSHGDVIKSIVAQAMGLHLDSFQRIVIDPASISVIRFSEGRTALLKSNDTSHLASANKKSDSRGHLLGGGSG